MIKVRNALVSGVIGASALIVPATVPAQPAGADTVPMASTVSTASTLVSAAKPCSKHKNPARCYARHGSGGGGGGGGGISDDSVTRGGSGGGIDN
ncbi:MULTISPECIES: hypothetical protein [Streptosporangium]|uniref:Membrane protein YgcG n=1 Tax=Streptosporangium brasiliense TaxID=47480 RepID=A0ABT9REF1_9ACTN|nr:hypothetical protein [Streptosporangium brasiliense]MDP9867648.1 putative membrane protein YgcG [Streptosporangium brasiliense]